MTADFQTQAELVFEAMLEFQWLQAEKTFKETPDATSFDLSKQQFGLVSGARLDVLRDFANSSAGETLSDVDFIVLVAERLAPRLREYGLGLQWMGTYHAFQAIASLFFYDVKTGPATETVRRPLM